MDFVPTSGSVTFSQNDSTLSVAVRILDDDIVEVPERFFLALSVPSGEGGVSLTNPRRVSIIITNDDCEYITHNISHKIFKNSTYMYVS